MIYLRDYRPLENTLVHGAAPWHERVLNLWTEDDATRNCEGHETAASAFERITKVDRRSALWIDSKDYGDAISRLHLDGWVLTESCEGGTVGVVVREAGEMGS